MAELQTAGFRHLQIAAVYGERFEGQPVRKGHLSWRMFFWRSNWFPHLTKKTKIDKIFLNQLRSHSPSSDLKSTPISWCLHNINPHTEHKNKLSSVPFRSKRNCLIYIVLAVRIAKCSGFIYLPSRGNQHMLFKTQNKMNYTFWICNISQIQYTVHFIFSFKYRVFNVWMPSELPKHVAAVNGYNTVCCGSLQ
jgi:hypothetical protein